MITITKNKLKPIQHQIRCYIWDQSWIQASNRLRIRVLHQIRNQVMDQIWVQIHDNYNQK
jgi:hypothetical protein